MQGLLVVEAGERAPQRLRRKALDLTDQAIAKVEQIAGNDPKAIHDVRRRLKELRALTLLLSSDLPEAGRAERNFFRDAGRELSTARDAKAALEAFDRLRERFADEWKPRQFQKIRGALAERVESNVDPDKMQRLHSELLVQRGRIAAWPVDEMRREALWRAITRSYRRARTAMETAIEERTVEAMHEWRKRVKVHWYHAQFFSAEDLAKLEPYAELLRNLSRSLGEHHDLVLVDEACRRFPQSFGTYRYVQSFRRFVSRGLTELEERAGRELFEEKPRAWTRRVRQAVSAERLRVGPKKAPQRAAARSAISAYRA